MNHRTIPPYAVVLAVVIVALAILHVVPLGMLLFLFLLVGACFFLMRGMHGGGHGRRHGTGGHAEDQDRAHRHP